MDYNFKEHLEKARQLYEQGSDATLRYCALELRFAIECHVYNQLRAGLGKIPESVINTWQPPQAIKALCMFEETADKDLKVTISGGEGEDIEVEYKNIQYKDLSKWYNTLGSYLHQPTIKNKNFEIDSGKLESIISKLSHIAECNLITFHRGYEKIKCEKCGKEILFTRNYVEKHNKLSCQNQGCRNYVIIRVAQDNNIESFQTAIIPCLKCNNEIVIPLCDIEDGSHVTCKKCKNEHMVRKFIQSEDKVIPVPEYTFEHTNGISE
ncbi:hypothetical protein ACU619_23760 [Klebsiella aerogenes]